MDRIRVDYCNSIARTENLYLVGYVASSERSPLFMLMATSRLEEDGLLGLLLEYL
jgi:hypothetical protein